MRCENVFGVSLSCLCRAAFKDGTQDVQWRLILVTVRTRVSVHNTLPYSFSAAGHKDVD